MTRALHKNLTGSELHYSKIDESALTIGSPPTYIGQSFFDTVYSIFYIAIGTSSVSDWQPVNGTGGTNSVVDSASTSYTVTTSNNGAVIRLTSGSARAVTLPNTPVNGFTVSIQDAYSTTGAAYTNNITVTASGSDLFQSGLASYKITSNLACVTFIYDTGLTCWVVRSSFIGLNPTVTTLTGTLGSDLVIGTADTQSVKLQVNSVDSLAVSTTNFEIKKNVVIDDISDITKQLAFSLGSSTTGTKTALNFVQTANRVISFPDLTDTLVSKTSTDTLTNKSFNNTTTMLAANQLNFNNSGDTYHTSLKAGANAADLDMTLPTTAPVGGQVLYSTDALGTLGWVSAAGTSQQDITSTTGYLTSFSASFINYTNTTTNDLLGIFPGTGGQRLSIKNNSSSNITVKHLSGFVPTQARIFIMSGVDMTISANTSIDLTYDITNAYWIVQDIASGIYTPTLSTRTSYFLGTVTPLQHMFKQIGNIVSVTGAYNCTPPGSSYSLGTMEVSLPTSTVNNFSFTNTVIGTVIGYQITSFPTSPSTSIVGYVCAQTGTKNAFVTIEGTTNANFVFIVNFQYQVI